MKKNVWFINQYITTPDIEGEGYRHYYIAKYLNAKTEYKPLLITASFAHAPQRHNRFRGLYKYVAVEVPTLILKVNKYKISGGLGRILNWIFFTLGLFLLPFISKKKVPKPDIIILSSLPILPVVNLMFFKLLYPRCKLVFEIRDLWPLSAIEFGGYSEDNLFIRFLGILEKWAYSNADLVISVLPRADVHIKQVLNHSNFNYQWITNGYSLSEDNPNMDLGDVISTPISEEDFKVAYAGTLVVANPLDTVIEVVRASEKKNLKLYILGGGPEKERLQELANGNDKIVFINKIPKQYVAAFLKKMDLLFMGKGFKNSKVYEFGTSQLKTFDYFNAKKPIIQALSSKENPVTYSGAGYVIEPEDAAQLSQKLEYFTSLDKKKLREYGIKGYNYLIENCTYEVINKKFHLTLRSLEEKEF
ncbi:MAG: glycosyltransferase WbuB [Allomuricauda sp.]|nr:MAG: glycosyltransferase WbuB [Allomuricauda sp.]